MRIEASAPGKLVLLGEYAVLEGAPALVLAIDRRVKVVLSTRSEVGIEIASPTLGLEARLRLRPDGVVWHGPAPSPLAWLATLFTQLPFTRDLPPCRIELDSDRFYLDHAGERRKLGFGSSAAVCVALLGALHACAGQPTPSLEACVQVHRAIQHGHGSGIDIAASLHGGLSHYQLDDQRAPHRTALAWPTGLHWCCAFSGKPASTESLLAKVAAWRERAPDLYTRHLHELATMAARGIDAVAHDDAAAFMSACHAYAGALARLGEASDADIASREHRELGTLAARCGAVYKSCGAGGGDVGITFAVDDRQLREFSASATRAGFPVIETQMDPQGLKVVATV